MKRGASALMSVRAMRLMGTMKGNRNKVHYLGHKQKLFRSSKLLFILSSYSSSFLSKLLKSLSKISVKLSPITA